jgi:hypothetical protein
MRDKQKILTRLYLKKKVMFKEEVIHCLKIQIMCTFYNSKEDAVVSDLL